VNTVILAEDEASIYLQASDKYVWAPRGQTPIVRVNTNRDCTHIYGSLNLITGKETVMRSQIMNSETTALYLNVLLHVYPDQPILLQANPRLEVMWFPAGAPDTNPQEHVWKDVRQHVCHAHTMNKFLQVITAVEDRLNTHSFPCSLLSKHGFFEISAMSI
jgi:hypothetical protein